LNEDIPEEIMDFPTQIITDVNYDQIKLLKDMNSREEDEIKEEDQTTIKGINGIHKAEETLSSYFKTYLNESDDDNIILCPRNI
jgi:hypothetical protein